MGWNVKIIFHALLFTLFVFSIEADSKVRFVPSHYKIDIVTKDEHFTKDDSSTMTYTGKVQIKFKKEPETFQEAFSIILNTNPKTNVLKLQLQANKITDSQEQEYEDITCPHEIKADKLIVNCDAIYKDRKRFILTVDFTNPFGDDMTGFYRSSYVDADEKKRWLLTTHFEPIFARNAFPCFDQPDLKAYFQVSVTVPASVSTVLSNTGVQQMTSKDKSTNTYEFKETNIPMSTYLVAFTASNLASTEKMEFVSEYKKRQTKNNHLQEVPAKKVLQTYGRKVIIEKKEGEFAQKVGAKAIEALTKYLAEGYALDKVDQVGIPDFSAGAMENFGHISFREKSLFYNNEVSTTMTKQSNLLTIVHELVHQWFGNLVTLESWNYIWLNEAFATYLEYIIASQFSAGDVNTSDWDLMNQFIVNEIHSRAFETDGLASAPKLNNEITNENLIFSAFNDIAYSKGAAVLRMWDNTLKGEFQKSLQKYINNRREMSANPGQLFEVFKEIGKMDEKMFKTWTEQAGYPVVEVKKTGNNTYTLTQSRFLWGKSDEKSSWYIPITFFTSESVDTKLEPIQWLESKLELKDVKGKWVIFNNQQVGYYRVNYEKENWEALSKALEQKEFSKIPEVHRAQLLNDIFSLARSVQKNYVSYSTAFNLAKYLEKETGFIPLKTALNSFDFFLPKLTSFEAKSSDSFKKYVLRIIEPHFKNLNSTESKHIDKLKKVDVTRWACSLDFDPCVKQSKELYKDETFKKYPDIQEIVLCTVVRSSNESVWNEIFDLYKNEKDSALRVMYLTALGCTGDSKKAKEFLERTLKVDSGIRKQDLIYVLSAVYSGNSKNLDTALEFVQSNFKEIAKIYGGINPLGRAIVGIARRTNTKEKVEKLKKLIEDVRKSDEGKGSIENLDNALKIAESNLAWTETKSKDFATYFNGSSTFASSLSLLFLCLLFVFRH